MYIRTVHTVVKTTPGLLGKSFISSKLLLLTFDVHNTTNREPFSLPVAFFFAFLLLLLLSFFLSFFFFPLILLSAPRFSENTSTSSAGGCARGTKERRLERERERERRESRKEITLLSGDHNTAQHNTHTEQLWLFFLFLRSVSLCVLVFTELMANKVPHSRYADGMERSPFLPPSFLFYFLSPKPNN